MLLLLVLIAMMDNVGEEINERPTEWLRQVKTL